jgi:hypothetical protein
MDRGGHSDPPPAGGVIPVLDRRIGVVVEFRGG